MISTLGGQRSLWCCVLKLSSGRKKERKWSQISKKDKIKTKKMSLEATLRPPFLFTVFHPCTPKDFCTSEAPSPGLLSGPSRERKSPNSSYTKASPSGLATGWILPKQFRLPISLCHHTWSSQLENTLNAECVSPHYHGDHTSQNLQN